MIIGKDMEQKVYEHWGRRFSLPPETFSSPGSIIALDDEVRDSNKIFIYHLGPFSVVRCDPLLAARLKIVDRQEGNFCQPELRGLVRENLDAGTSLEVDDSGGYSYLKGEKFKPFSAGGRQEPVQLDPESDRELIREFCRACPPGDVEDAELEEGQESDAVSFGHIVNGKLMAYAGFRYWDEVYGDIGVLTHPSARGRGLARSAASKLCEWCLEHDVIPMYRVSDENLASSRIPESLGFTRMVVIEVLKVSQP